MPEKVSPRSNASPLRLKWRWSSPVKTLRARQLAGQQPRRQRQAREHADLAALGLGEEQLGRALAEHVVDDLHRLHAGVLDRLQRILDALDADAVEPHLPGLHQVVEDPEHLGLVVDVRRRAVQLQQIQRVGLEILQAALDEGGQVLAVEALGDERLQALAGLGRDVERVAALAAQARQQLFTVAVAVDVGGVEEVHAAIQRAVQRRQRLAIVDRAPGAADGPGAEADR